ncbi:hypothetical protein PV387_39415 [Streptomyces sp. ME02-6987-2C]|uniref:hypothetical protein n=1 Tax=unclassified Streptomyces TaxID=2593676 RepID=UPI0029B0E351|nr:MULTISPECIES: hypothetical protein [unclassified Streptomyces]MDX3345938.1 hypothetical protein [Streptomyces sp. ME02-6979A]MDX3371988.1 hypothetical protein [Streptomyces sp. ME02-6987-2C]MDX3412202.1 hypothetical protein [Streptomyces sp. ME02-6977A]MDX3421704.1 hypothetical protein [Streptomyces sp. ME02-6985-2c]
MPRTPGPLAQPDHKISDATRTAIKEWEAHVAKEVELRNAARKALADELKTNPDLPVAALAKVPEVPWGIQTIWTIAKEYDVPPRQPNKSKRGGKD